MANDMSYDEIQQAVRAAFYKVNPTRYDPVSGAPESSPYLGHVFDGYVIYSDGQQLYRCSYEIGENGVVEFSDEPEAVAKQVSYVPTENEQRPAKVRWQSVENCGGPGGTMGPCPGGIRESGGEPTGGSGKKTYAETLKVLNKDLKGLRVKTRKGDYETSFAAPKEMRREKVVSHLERNGWKQESTRDLGSDSYKYLGADTTMTKEGHKVVVSQASSGSVGIFVRT